MHQAVAAAELAGRRGTFEHPGQAHSSLIFDLFGSVLRGHQAARSAVDPVPLPACHGAATARALDALSFGRFTSVHLCGSDSAVGRALRARVRHGRPRARPWMNKRIMLLFRGLRIALVGLTIGVVHYSSGEGVSQTQRDPALRTGPWANLSGFMYASVVFD